MSTQWFVAKYIPDLRRREPRNVGVVLFVGDTAHHRFIGDHPERPLGVEGRSVAKSVASSETYKAWVEHWRQASESGPREALLEHRVDDSYYLERGGFVIAGNDEPAEALLDRLFAMLVQEEPSVAAVPKENPLANIIAAFEELSAESFSVTPNYVIDLDSDRLFFDFAVQNGSERSLFRALKLNRHPEKTWRALHETIYSVMAASQGRVGSPYALIVTSDTGDQLVAQKKTLDAKLGKRALYADIDPGGVVREVLRAAHRSN